MDEWLLHTSSRTSGHTSSRTSSHTSSHASATVCGAQKVRRTKTRLGNTRRSGERNGETQGTHRSSAASAEVWLLDLRVLPFDIGVLTLSFLTKVWKFLTKVWKWWCSAVVVYDHNIGGGNLEEENLKEENLR